MLAKLESFFLSKFSTIEKEMNLITFQIYVLYMESGQAPCPRLCGQNQV